MQLYESSEDYFRRRTGKRLSEWRVILDEWRALQKGHTQMMEYLCKEKGVNSEWAEAIAIRYQKEAYM